MIEFRILGPLEVVDNGRPIALGGLRRRSALAILLLNAGRVVAADRLADDLYAGAAPATSVTQVQRQISELRRLLPNARIETTPPGYVLRIEPEQFDLTRFERLVEQDRLQEALDLWRGPALADLADEPFAHSAIARLEELRLAALERRLEADLASGRAADAVPELEELVAVHPLRERLVELLMLALYRAGRQADALAAYRAKRTLLSKELGLEPAPALRELEAAILRQAPELALQEPGPPTVLAVSLDQAASPALVQLAAGDAREAILLQLVTSETALTAAATAVAEARMRTAAFVAIDWEDDVIRFAAAHDAALLLVDAPPDLPADILQRSSADVALVYRGDARVDGGDVYVPFGGGEHDWAALELGASAARDAGCTLRLVGTGGVHGVRRDASRLLADASLAVQRALDVATVPVLAPAAPDALVAVVEDAMLVVTGIGARWQSQGLGQVRTALASGARSPVVFVHRGPRPGLLAPRASMTRFTWSLQN